MAENQTGQWDIFMERVLSAPLQSAEHWQAWSEQDCPQVPGLTFQEWKLEPYRSPSPTPCQTSSLLLTEMKGVSGESSRSAGSGWVGAADGSGPHSPRPPQPQEAAQLLGRASCKFNGGEQLLETCWGRSQTQTLLWVDSSLQTAADRCPSAPGPSCFTTVMHTVDLTLCKFINSSLT